MKVYLAARFSRLPELLGYRAELEAQGIEVTSRWLLGGHEWEGTDDDALPQEVGARFAEDDIADINAADAIVCFTEAPRSGPSRGGRHIEAGYALAMGKILLLVGPRENVFYALPEFHHFATWPEAREMIVRGAAFRRIVEESQHRRAEHMIAAANRAGGA